MDPDNKNSIQDNPFPGLRPFRPGEEKFFFGRENESREIAEKLLQNRFVAVIGTSGCGKTSLIRCGLLPLLEKGSSENEQPWRILSIRPGNDPFGHMADALAEILPDKGIEKDERDRIIGLLKEGSEGIPGIPGVAGKSGEGRLLLIVDQFEELFRYGSPDLGVGSVKETAAFVSLLTRSVSPLYPGFYLVVALRSDLISECSQYKGFTSLINNSNFLVPRMTREGLKEAIEGPVRNMGARIDGELIEHLADECASRAEQLPLLQHILMRTWALWKELDEPGKPVSLTTYSSAGAVGDIISKDADEVFDKLDPAGKIICERLFKSVTGKGADGKGVRYPSSVRTIKQLVRCTDSELMEVIERFRDPSLSVLTPEYGIPLDDDSIIDLSHESIIQLWERLRKWVEEEAASVAVYLSLSEASALYQGGKTGLLRQPELQVAINWREQNNPTVAWARKYNPAFERAMVYLRTSEKEFREEEERKARQQWWRFRRIRIISTLLGVAVGVSALAMAGVLISKFSADRKRKLAERQKYEMAAQDSATREYAALALKKSLVADSTALAATFREQEEKRLRLNTQDQLAKAESIAKESGKLATAAQNEARAAVGKSNETHRLRMLSVARSMALRSLQMGGQADLQALLAYQAYLFNRNFHGSPNDADIYMGLYNLAKENGSPFFKSFSEGAQGKLKSIACAPGSNEFYTSDSEGKILKWDLNNGPQAYRMIYQDSEITDVMAISPGSDWLACGRENSSIRLIPLKGTGQSYELNGHRGSVRSVVFSYDGKYLYSAALDGKVLKWDLAAKTSTNMTTGEIQITAVDISPAGNYLAGITPKGTGLVWNPGNSSDRFTIESEGKAIRSIRFRPGNAMFAVGFDDGTVEIWDAAKREKITGIKAHSGTVADIRFNAYRPQMATSGEDGILRLWDLENLNSVPISIDDAGGPLISFDFGSGGTVIVSAIGGDKASIISRPSYADTFAADGCKYVTRNFTPEEWQAYVGKDIDYEKTCPGADLKIKIRELR